MMTPFFSRKLISVSKFVILDDLKIITTHIIKGITIFYEQKKKAIDFLNVVIKSSTLLKIGALKNNLGLEADYVAF